MKKWTLIAVIMTVLAASQAVFAAVPVGSDRLMAVRAAKMDAYRNMAARIMGLKVSSDTTVRNFVAEDDRIALSLDHFIKGLRIDDDKTACYDDGSCEVTVEVTLAEVITELTTACSKYCKGGKWTEKSFVSMKTYTNETVLTEIGSGAIRTDRVLAEPGISLPEPDAQVYVSGNPRDKVKSLPPVYKKYGAQKRLTAERIAKADAYRNLVERIYGLRITSTTLVRDLDPDLSSDWIRGKLEGELKGMQVGEVTYQPDGIVEVRVSLTLEQVVTTLKKVCDEYYNSQGRRIKISTLEEMQKQTNRRVIRVVGMGSIIGSGSAVPTTNDGASPAVGSGDSGDTTHTETVITKKEPEVIVVR